MNPIPNNDTRCAVIFDLDNTITRKDTYVSFLLFVMRRRPLSILPASWLPIAVLVHKLGLKNNSWLKLVFLQTIVNKVDRKLLDQWTDIFVNNLLSNALHVNAVEAIRKHKKTGDRLVLASASFDFYVNKLGKKLGFDDVVCTIASWDKQDQLAASFYDKNCYGQEKLNKLTQYFGNERENYHLIAYTDHHSDEPLLSWVDQAHVVNPTAKLRKIAERKNYVIHEW